MHYYLVRVFGVFKCVHVRSYLIVIESLFLYVVDFYCKTCNKFGREIVSLWSGLAVPRKLGLGLSKILN